ncbi:MAG: hypothetical protein ACYDH1_10710 [Anaerolineaceae bacterium]
MASGVAPNARPVSLPGAPALASSQYIFTCSPGTLPEEIVLA